MASWTENEIGDLAGTTAVVTGASSGLGAVTASRLAGHGAKVVMAVRNLDKGRKVAAEIDGDVDVRKLDLEDLASVRAFADSWEGDLDLLVNNAGIMMVPKGRTKDGFERQLGTNHLGHFALTNLLLPHVTHRVVTVSSTAHKVGRIGIDDLNFEQRRYRPISAYGQSKLANLLFTSELQHRLDAAGSKVVAVAAHPGYSSTNLQSGTAFWIYNVTSGIQNKLFAQSDEAGAQPTLYAATQDLPGNAFVGPDGFQELRGAPTLVGRTKHARDDEMARRLWERSEELTGVSFGLRTPAAA